MGLIKYRERAPDYFLGMRPFDMPGRLGRLIDETFGPGYTEPIGWAPVVDIIEMESELLLTAELPGLALEDVDVEIENNILTIRGEKKQEKEEKTPRYHVFERSYGRFERSFTLPRSVDADKIKAEIENGVLRVHMPKTVEAKGRKIEVLTRK